MMLTSTTAPAVSLRPNQLADAVDALAPISLSEMNDVALMRRMDTKYIVHQDLLPAILAAASEHYAVLDINGLRMMRYSSQYFDTPTCRFFRDHHNGRTHRQKIRIRHYVDSRLGFLEIKLKNGKGITDKRRIDCTDDSRAGMLSPRALEFIRETIEGVGELQATVHNSFRRITLVDTIRGERVTLDWDLASHLGPAAWMHRNLVVVEVKQEGLDRHAPIMAFLKSAGCRPFRVSKYCLGMTRLYPALRANRFKPKLHHIVSVTADTRH